MTSETFANLASALSDAIVAIAAGVAAFFAVKGVNTYRGELFVKDEYELARRLIHHIYRVRDGFRHVRNPLIHAAEYPEETRNLTGPEALSPENNFKSQSHAYQKRWEVLGAAMRDLEAEMVQAQVFWGQSIQELMPPVRECLFVLQLSIQHWLLSIKGEDPGLSREDMLTEQKVLYSMGSIDKDEFAQKIQVALDAIEKIARPHLKPQRDN